MVQKKVCVEIDTLTQKEANLFQEVKDNNKTSKGYNAKDNINLSILVSNPDIFHIGRWIFKDKKTLRG